MIHRLRKRGAIVWLSDPQTRERGGRKRKNLDLIDLSGSGEAGLRLWPRTDPDSRVNQNDDWVQRSFPGGISRVSVFVHGRQKASVLYLYLSGKILWRSIPSRSDASHTAGQGLNNRFFIMHFRSCVVFLLVAFISKFN